MGFPVGPDPVFLPGWDSNDPSSIIIHGPLAFPPAPGYGVSAVVSHLICASSLSNENECSLTARKISPVTFVFSAPGSMGHVVGGSNSGDGCWPAGLRCRCPGASRTRGPWVPLHPPPLGGKCFNKMATPSPGTFCACKELKP